MRLPEHIRDVIRYRLRPLSEPARRLLEVASVLGREFDVTVLAGAREVTAADALAALDEAIRVGLVTEVAPTHGSFRFAHALIRETLYGDLSAAMRARLHRRIGELLESLPAALRADRLTELALHFGVSAALDQGRKAATYAQAAGEQALGRLAYEEAAGYFGQALAAFPADAEPGMRIRLLLQHADALWRANETAAARAASLTGGGSRARER